MASTFENFYECADPLPFYAFLPPLPFLLPLPLLFYSLLLYFHIFPMSAIM